MTNAQQMPAGSAGGLSSALRVYVQSSAETGWIVTEDDGKGLLTTALRRLKSEAPFEP